MHRFSAKSGLPSFNIIQGTFLFSKLPSFLFTVIFMFARKRKHTQFHNKIRKGLTLESQNWKLKALWWNIEYHKLSVSPLFDYFLASQSEIVHKEFKNK